MKRMLALLIFVVSAMVACSQSEPPPPPKVEDTVFGDMVGAKERARVETEQAMEKHKEQMENALKKSEVDQ